MTAPPVDQSAAADTYGLQKLSVNGGRDDINNDRDFSRSGISSGGTMTGKAFQTDGVDPRIVIDSTKLSAHRTDGTETVKLDVSTGVLTFFADATDNGMMTWTNSAGTEIARIAALDNGASSGGVFIGGEGAGGTVEIAINFGLAGWTDIALSSASASMVARSAALTASAAVSLDGTGVATISGLPVGGTSDVVTIRNGHIILNDASSTQKFLLCALSTFTCTFGYKNGNAGAGESIGGMTQYRMVRGNTSGAVVTPGAFTLTSVITQSNATGPVINTIRGESAQLTFTATAAGQAFYYVNATAS